MDSAQFSVLLGLKHWFVVFLKVFFFPFNLIKLKELCDLCLLNETAGEVDTRAGCAEILQTCMSVCLASSCGALRFALNRGAQDRQTRRHLHQLMLMENGNEFISPGGDVNPIS